MVTNDPEFYESDKIAREKYEAPPQHGCFFYGCIFASVLVVLMLISVGLGFYFLYRGFSQVVAR